MSLVTPKHTKSTLIKMAACQVLGLHYWADHPLPGRVWAVDEEQHAHVVRVYSYDPESGRLRTPGHHAVLQRVYEQVTGYRTVWVAGTMKSHKEPVTRLVSDDDGPAVPFAVTEDTPALFAA